MQINLKDGDYVETTKKFEVQYENMNEYLRQLVRKKKKRKKKVEEEEDEDWCGNNNSQALPINFTSRWTASKSKAWIRQIQF